MKIRRIALSLLLMVVFVLCTADACSTCDWQDSNCPIQTIEKSFLP
jgi:hypothetical protein